jgi:hypothetical protein
MSGAALAGLVKDPRLAAMRDFEYAYWVSELVVTPVTW